MSNSRNKNRNTIIFSGMDEDQQDFYPIIADGDDDELFSASVPDVLPILPLRNAVLFPGVVMPISVGRSKSLNLVREAYSGTKMLGTVAQRNGQIEDPVLSDLYTVGTMAEILKILEMPDGTTTVILQGKKRILIERLVKHPSYLKASVIPLPEVVSDTKSHEFSAIIESLKDFSLKIVKSSANIPQEAQFAVKNIENVTFLVNFICNNTELNTEEKQDLLERNDIRDRSTKLLSLLMREVQMLELKKDIQQKVKVDLDQQQREYLLHQQIKTIQDELGGSPVQQEVEELKKRAALKLWSEDIQKLFEKELGKLSRMNPAAGEYSVQLGYLDTLLDLPWNQYTDDNFDLNHAEKVLNEDHFGLDNVKERILEHLA
ncbi:MAG TPA: LON peptidase substrate-binding domain-containing protein, partial [Prolixibacteraceae bacterium]|nr:LON peptidase substrate-binding domain-containing protein [Prolixibacteraceae bacterium]